ncbi:hypothetical protein SGM_2332 [Streptomyces griseoaurantiacus M045]|uniref:FXSXX-COOH protein n=1 Tax=Streptomyces griseoaurantiacus M045 TaxID=996637 RepID=F3NGR8_9ACTN|nr:hypothetical protein SGM_2332 [Streptomyces griseoaurantiacus M045]
MEFDVVNLSGSVALDLDDLPENALGESMRRVLRDVVEGSTPAVAAFESSF